MKADFGYRVAPELVGQRGPGNERVHGSIDIPVVLRTTGAHPFPHLQSVQSGGSVEAPARAARPGGIPTRHFDVHAPRLTAFGREHGAECAVPSREHGLTHSALQALEVVAADVDGTEPRDEIAADGVVALPPSEREALLDAAKQSKAPRPMCLSNAPFEPLMRGFNEDGLLAVGQALIDYAARVSQLEATVAELQMQNQGKTEKGQRQEPEPEHTGPVAP